MDRVLRISAIIAAFMLFVAVAFVYEAAADEPVLGNVAVEDNLNTSPQDLYAKIASSLENHNTNAEIKFLQENGIIKGDPNGDLRPYDELSRAEFATILCRAIGIEELALSAAILEKNYFSDVPATHWAAGYINAAVDYRAINGFADGTFRPGLSVTNEQVVKMLVAAWGYGEEAEELGGYPNGYMEIAQRFGVTDAVLFNYGVASKRWVACSFTYGALTMPTAENYELDTPVKIEQTEVRTPRPENSDYITDPAAILKRVTPQSAKYERTVFEQKVPSGFMPVQLHNNTLIYAGKDINGRVQFYFGKSDSKQAAMQGNLLGGDNIDLSTLPQGKLQFHLTIIAGPVKDTYMTTVEKNSAGVVDFISDIFRYTVLNAQPNITEVRHDLILTNSQKDEKNPFVIEALNNEAAKPILRVSYPYMVMEDYIVDIGITSIEAGELFFPPIYFEGEPNMNLNAASRPIRGQNELLKPMIIDGLSINECYQLGIRVGHYTGDDVALRGDIVLIEKDGKLDFLLEGMVRYLTIDGFEIVDYEIEDY